MNNQPFLVAFATVKWLGYWAIILWVFLPPLRSGWMEQALGAVLGTSVSYVLDIPAVFIPLLTVAPIRIC